MPTTKKSELAELLREEIEVTEKELKRIHAVVARIPKLNEDLAAYKRTLASLFEEHTETGGEPQQTLREKSMASQAGQLKLGSIPSQVYRILKEAGKPMTTDQIMPLLAAYGKHANKAVVVGAIYRSAKRGQLFKIVSPGRFGLLDWSENQREEKGGFMPKQTA